MVVLVRKKRYLLVLVLLLGGCGPPALELGVGSVIEQSLPSGIQGLSDYWGLRAGYTNTLASVGLALLDAPEDDTALLVIVDASIDVWLLLFAWGHETFRSPTNWLSVRPGLGLWGWSDAPDNVGFQVGCRVGYCHDFTPGTAESQFGSRAIRFEIGRLWLYGVRGSDDARLDFLEVSYVHEF